MKLFAKSVVAILLVSAPMASAFAQTTYGEIGYHAVDYAESGAPTATVGMVSATLGVELNKYLALEGFIAGGVSDDTVRVTGVNVQVEAKNAFGFYLKPKVSLSDNFELFAKLGWVSSEIEASSGGFSVSDTGGDMAYGVGAQVNFNKNVYLSGGYTNWYDKQDIKIDGWNVSLGYKF